MLLGAAVLLAAGLARASVPPPTVPFPNAYYPGAEDPSTDAGAQSGQTSPPYYPSPWQDTSTAGAQWDAARQKAIAFVSQLTLTEKVNLTTGVGWEGDRCVGNTGDIPRMGFRAMCLEDSPLGVRDTDYNSAFPAGVQIAASWDRSAAYQRGRGMGAEHFGKGVDVQLGPVVGPLGRSPEGGRNWEGFSPDPVLSGQLVAETVKGIQDSGVIACTKHYIGNEQEHFRSPGDGTAGLDAISSNIDDVTMHELYLWPFADAVRAGTGSIMCSYNKINNSFGCQNSYSLNYHLKGELGFQGFIMSDWSAQHTGVATTLAGLDQTMPGDQGFDSGNAFWGANLTVSVLNGSVPQWRIDDMATRIMTAWYYVGRDQNNPPEPNFSAWTLASEGARFYESGANVTTINEHTNVQANHAAQIRSQANRGTVLLKNTNNALPLTGMENFVGIFGDDAAVQQGGPNACGDRGCDQGTMAMGWGSGTANFPYLIDPLTAIKKHATNVNRDADVQEVVDNNNLGAIQSIASQSDVALVFVNTDGGEGYITVDGNEGDRNNLTLWQGGESLIGNVTQYSDNVIVVIHSIGPVLLSSWYNNPAIKAIVWAGVPGQESGNSITDILYGKANPGGKLPYTLGATREDYGTDLLYTPNNGLASPQANFAEGRLIDYRGFDKRNVTPIYEFGYGLSYTNFTIDSFVVTANGHFRYKANKGNTTAAPTYGVIGTAADYLFPTGFNQLRNFIYPFLSSTNLKEASGDLSYGDAITYPAGAQDGTPQAKIPAGGAPGGNPMLYDVLFTVTCMVHNTGSRGGDEVVQLYVNHGDPSGPVRVLRDFDRVHVPAGGSTKVKLQLTRRDLSNWDVASQNWVVTTNVKTIYVGNSSRNFAFTQTLNPYQAAGVVAGVHVVETIDTDFAAATAL